MEYYCDGCSPSNYASKDQTWTAQGSAQPGTWAPYGFNAPPPRDEPETFYATTSQAWTIGGNITPNNSLPVGSYVTKTTPNKSGLPVGAYYQNSRPGKEGYCMTGQNYGNLNSAWAGNRPYTLN